MGGSNLCGGVLVPYRPDLRDGGEAAAIDDPVSKVEESALAGVAIASMISQQRRGVAHNTAAGVAGDEGMAARLETLCAVGDEHSVQGA